MAKKGEMKNGDKFLISALIFFIILLGIILYIDLTDQNSTGKEMYFDKSYPEIEYSIYNDNMSKNYYLKIGYIRYENGKPVEGANATIKINNTIFSSITDLNGYTNFTISSKEITLNELNGMHTVTILKEGYKDLIFDIDIEYKP